MVTYIYFVKCPNCEDEHFDFFDDAKGFAMGCLSKKPIITQTEVCRNDFGECTDHCDFGTVWSWEDVVGKETEEPGTNIFSKGDFGKYNPENDPEFAEEEDDFRLVNGLEEAVTAGISFRNSEDFAEFKKLCDEIGIVTMGDVKNFMQENDADASNILDKLRAYRDELGPDFKIKEARKPVPEGMTIEQLVEEMEENEDEVECTWCNDLFPKDMCKKEVNLGYLCPRCADGIISRGETLTFKENNYWDFLDEKFDIDFEDEASSDSLDDKADLDNSFADVDFFNEDFDSNEKVDLEYTDLTFTVYGPQRDVDDWDEWEKTSDYTYTVDKSDVAAVIWDFMTEEDAKTVAGGLEALEDNETWEKFLDVHFDELLEKYYEQVLEYYEDAAKEECSRNYED